MTKWKVSWMMQVIKNLLRAKTVFGMGCLYTLFLTFSLLAPGKGLPSVSIPFFDKWVHIVALFLLTYVWLLYRGLSYSKKITAIQLGFLCFIYGIIIEALQHWFTASRTADVFDVIANGIGCLLGYIVFIKTRNIFISQKSI